MPNRMLRDWTKSISMDNLSLGAERFFTRLIMKADDYGSFYADPKILRSELFPLKIDEITNGEIESWLEECLEQSLIIIYTAEGKNLLRIVNFGQRLQNKRNKFPDPDGITVNHRESPPELEYELEIENEVEAQLWPTFDDFWGLYGKKVGKPKAEKKWKKIPQVAREEIMGHLELYVRSTPDVKYRKDPATYLNNESWKDEIINHGRPATVQDKHAELDRLLKNRANSKGAT